VEEVASMKYFHAQQLMTLRQLNEALKEVTYRSGYNIEVFNNPYEGPYLSVKVWVEDASNSGGELELRINSPIPNIARYDNEHFYEWLLERLIKIEIHEVCEFFRVGGVKFYDPHNPIEPPSESS
jgi:hypothetical protein